jgi:hypothetical protein
MGLGDWIMASGEVKEANERTGLKVKIGNKQKMFNEPLIFVNNPRMADRNEDATWVRNYPGCRPYLKGQSDGRMIFNDDYKPIAGEIWLSKAEKLYADTTAPKEPFILIEPNVKRTYIHTVNKAWHYWEDLVKHDYPWLQIGDKTINPITRNITTKDFRQALAILSKASLFVGTDGGLHHAAAALGIPSVVIWTGFTSPKHLGYDEHLNIYDGGEPCGYYAGVCPHCSERSRAITVQRVLDAINTKWCPT